MKSEVAGKSPTGKYSLTINEYETKKGCWNYSEGVLFRGSEVVSRVQRNYHRFPFSWLKQGDEEYLVCGEDYQGQTVVRCSDGERVDYKPDSVKNGFGFCWVQHGPDNDDHTVIKVEGCYWACPYEIRRYDCSDPMALPYPMLEKRDLRRACEEPIDRKCPKCEAVLWKDSDETWDGWETYVYCSNDDCDYDEDED